MACDSVIVPPYILSVPYLSSATDIYFNTNHFTGETTLNLHFNPAANTFLYLYDAFGRQVLETTITSKTTAFTGSQLPSAGIYFYSLKTGKAIIARGKTILE